MSKSELVEKAIKLLEKNGKVKVWNLTEWDVALIREIDDELHARHIEHLHTWPQNAYTVILAQ